MTHPRAGPSGGRRGRRWVAAAVREGIEVPDGPDE
jgi:hypothetical protein